MEISKTSVILIVILVTLCIALYQRYFYYKKKNTNVKNNSNFLLDLDIYFENIKTAAEGMVKNTKNISQSTNSAARMASNTLERFQEIEDVVEKLNQSSNEIGEILNFVSNIAQQTNLLALNASIEASRAGDAGKGFAVVANEVKELSKQTKLATKEIKQKIDLIQAEINRVESSVGNTTSSISDLNEINQVIAVAIEKQRSFNNEITVSIQEAGTKIKGA